MVWPFKTTACAIAPFLLAVLASLRAPCVCAEEPSSRISFVDEQGAEHKLSESDLAKLRRVRVKVTPHDSQPAEYEGVPLSDLLESQGVTLGKELRGARIANYVLLEAKDGYRVALAIAEVDPATTDKVVLLADRKNGEALPEKEGPLRLVIPDEKRSVRWIRMVTRISVRTPESQP
jgi:DMSO/TMAO reductase YedYZ molybdopterin-dependent catalytic subunit